MVDFKADFALEAKQKYRQNSLDHLPQLALMRPYKAFRTSAHTLTSSIETEMVAFRPILTVTEPT
ncbi:MAG: hypothetical protein CMF50_10650 [Legionellales bacterium]|nr:hypothetical protein [Legionellales bacterium]